MLSNAWPRIEQNLIGTAVLNCTAYLCNWSGQSWHCICISVCQLPSKDYSHNSLLGKPEGVFDPHWAEFDKHCGAQCQRCCQPLQLAAVRVQVLSKSSKHALSIGAPFAHTCRDCHQTVHSKASGLYGGLCTSLCKNPYYRLVLYMPNGNIRVGQSVQACFRVYSSMTCG